MTVTERDQSSASGDAEAAQPLAEGAQDTEQKALVESRGSQVEAMGHSSETVTEFGWQFDDGEVWDWFKSAQEASDYIAEQMPPGDEENYAGHVVTRTRQLVISAWSAVQS